MSRLHSFIFTIVLALSSVAAADYEDGINAAFEGDYETALREFTAAAEAGLDLAQFNLALLYYNGQGVKQSFRNALEWAEKAGNQGHATAQYMLGTLYYNGQGTRSNAAQALEWYQLAAAQGHAQAQYNLATMYRDAEGTEQDLVKAHFWANVARENEFAPAQELQQEIARMMTNDQQRQAEQDFIEWLLAR